MRHWIMPLAFAVAVATGGVVSAQGKQDFILENATGYTIKEVFVSPTNDDDWGEDIMGRDVLEDGDEVPIQFARKEKTCKWDLRVTYDDDNERVVWRGFDLCQISKITIKYHRASGRTSATTQ